MQLMISKQIRQRKSKVIHFLYNDSTIEGSYDELMRRVILQRQYSSTDASKMLNMAVTSCQDIFQDKLAMEEFESADLIIGMSFLPCKALIAEYVGKPFIVLHATSFQMAASFLRVPMPASYVPLITSGSTDKMGFYERVLSSLYHKLIDLALSFLFLSRYCPIQLKYNIRKDKSIEEIVGMAQIHIVQLDFAVEFTHPLMPSKYDVFIRPELHNETCQVLFHSYFFTGTLFLQQMVSCNSSLKLTVY